MTSELAIALAISVGVVDNQIDPTENQPFSARFGPLEIFEGRVTLRGQFYEACLL